MSAEAHPVSVDTVVRRKAPSLPRFVEIPSSALERFDLSGTTPVEVELNGSGIGRRNLKEWGPDRDCWFIDLTQKQCREADVDTGDRVTVTFRLASTRPPEELLRLLERSGDARARWHELTPGRRRMLADHVRAAKKETTRKRRAEKALLGSEG